MSDEAVYRTAPATPGLVNSQEIHIKKSQPYPRKAKEYIEEEKGRNKEEKKIDKKKLWKSKKNC